MADQDQVTSAYRQAYCASVLYWGTQLPITQVAKNDHQVWEIVNFPGNGISCFHGVRAWDTCSTCEAMAQVQDRHHVKFTQGQECGGAHEGYL